MYTYLPILFNADPAGKLRANAASSQHASGFSIPYPRSCDPHRHPAALANPTPSYPPPPTPTASPSPTLEPTHAPEVCSPLEDIALSELSSPDLLKNPFQRPRLGWDEGHHGVDFAYWSWGSRKTMAGLPVHAVLAGRVAGVLPERMPYGHAVIIETALNDLPPAWLAVLPGMGKDPIPTPAPAASLYCPPWEAGTARMEQAALYLLYAHLYQPSPLTLGQTVTCGETLGGVGTTGNSVNNHLHLETRLGPAGASFSIMGHYQNNASDAEMSAYCAWRVSGVFQLLDPMNLLSQK